MTSFYTLIDVVIIRSRAISNLLRINKKLIELDKYVLKSSFDADTSDTYELF